MSVFPDGVEMIAPRFGRDCDVLLGRAVAHELGHLLLGMAAHAPSGLMKARWSERPMQALAPGDWVFSEIEARQLREAARARSAAPKAADRIAAVTATAAATTRTFIAPERPAAAASPGQRRSAAPDPRLHVPIGSSRGVTIAAQAPARGVFTGAASGPGLRFEPIT
jgi:hypothetical protein